MPGGDGARSAAGQPAAAPSSSQEAAAAAISSSRRWAAGSSIAAGAPPPLQLLPSLPHAANPAWRRAPSFAAAAALLVPPAVDASARNGKAHAATAADLEAAAAAADCEGLLGRALWALGARGAFFVRGTPYAHLQGLPHSQAQLLPATLANLPARELAGDGAASSSSSSVKAAERRRQQAAAVFYEVAADQRSGALRCLGWLLCHLFR